MKLLAQQILRYCAALVDSSGEKETESFLQGNALLPRGWGHFIPRGGWRQGPAAGAVCRSGGRPARAGQSSRPRLGPGTLRPNGHRRVSAPGPSTCVRVPSVPGRISSPATVLSRHLSARPPLSHPPAPPRPGRRRALTVHLRSGRLAARRPGAPGSGHTLIPPGHRRTSVPGPQPPTWPRGEACAATGRGRLPPSRGPAARLGLVELLALGLQAVARPAAQHPRRHVLDAVHPAAAAKLPSRLRATERVPTSHPSLGTARPRTAPGPPSGEEPSSRPAPRPRPILSPPLAPPRPAGPWPASPAPPPLYPGARHS